MTLPETPEHQNQIDGFQRWWALDAFCDENGEINTDLPRANWEVNFLNFGSNTMVETIVTYESLKDLETIIQMGMEEGWLLLWKDWTNYS